jgi:hypothetical protein
MRAAVRILGGMSYDVELGLISGGEDTLRVLGWLGRQNRRLRGGGEVDSVCADT